MSDYRIVAEWLRYAQNDLAVAKHYDECMTNIAIFKAQQVYDFVITHCPEPG